MFRTVQMKRMLSRSLAWVQVITISMGLTISPVANGLQLELKKSLKVRKLIDSQMERVALLGAGSIVDIPDEYRIPADKQKPMNVEETLNNWLKTAGQVGGEGQPGLHDFDGEKRDYFFPVTILKLGKDSDVGDLATGTHYMALSKLARKGNLLVVTETARLLSTPPKATSLPTPMKSLVPLPNETGSMEAQTPTCPDGQCAPRTQSAVFESLVKALQPGLKAADQNICKAYNNSDAKLKYAEKRMRETCGFTMNEILPEVRRQAEQSGVPADLLISIMVQESAGECHILNSETNSSQSVGLWQVNTHATRIRRCTTAQKQKMRGKSFAQLAQLAQLQNEARCLENPSVNLSEAIRIFKDNMNLLVQPQVRLPICVQAKGKGRSGTCVKTQALSVQGFSSDRLKDTNGNWSADMWRLAASGYNGGPGWVLRAKNDLETFNAKHGTQLDPYNWEDLRVFYMRRYLDRYSNGHMQFFGNGLSGRSVSNSILNLTYAENMVPRPEQLRQCQATPLRSQVAQRLATQ